MSLESILQQMLKDNKSSRELLDKATHDISQAINNGDYDRLDNIIHTATSKLENLDDTSTSDTSGEDGTKTVESGSTNGSVGVQDTTSTPETSSS